MLDNPKEGQFDFDFPRKDYILAGETFSVGIYQWVKTTDGKRIKKSKAVYRVFGHPSTFDRVRSKVEELCKLFNEAGHKTIDKKSEKVR